MQTGFHSGVIVLREGRAGLFVEVSGRILFEQLTRTDFVGALIKYCHPTHTFLLLPRVGRPDVWTLATDSAHIALLLCVALGNGLLAEVGGHAAVVRFGGLGGLVDSVDLFSGLADAYIDAFAGDVFESVIIVPAVGGLVEYDSVFGFVCELEKVGLDHILRPFDFSVGKVIHSV